MTSLAGELRQTPPIRCVVVDDHEALRRGVSSYLDAQDGIEVVGTGRDGRSAIEVVELRRPDIVVLDVLMPWGNGPEVCETLLSRGSTAQVVLFTGSDDAALVEAGLAAGARGFVLKTSPLSELVRAIGLVHEGGTYVDGALASGLVGRREDRRRSRLSDREEQVLQRLADGDTTDAAAAALFLSPATVRTYIEGAMQKLETRNRTAAVATALRRGLID